jgi:hypothetical protein
MSKTEGAKWPKIYYLAQKHLEKNYEVGETLWLSGRV